MADGAAVGMIGAGMNSPSGIRAGASEGGVSPLGASVGAPQVTGRTTYMGTDQNTPPGPSIFMWNKFDFMYECFYELGGFYDGTALVKSVVETDDQYMERRRVSYFQNYFKPIINATYLPVFASPVSRKTMIGDNEDKAGENAPLWFNFQKNTDRNGLGIHGFTKKAIKFARILGSAFVIVDNFPEIPKLREDAIALRRFPFVVLRYPQQVEPELVVLGEANEIREIGFREKNEGDEKRWHLWTEYYSVMVGKNKEGDYVEIGPRYEHDLGKCPVIPVSSEESEEGTITPHPPYYSIARCNWALFNVSSAQMRLLRSQMFSILCAPKMENGFGASPNRGFELPANNSVTGESYPLPFYLAPPVGPYQEIGGTVSSMREELYRLAGQEGVTGVVQARSGIAKSFDFSAEEWVLKDTALMAQGLESKIVEFFKLYTGEEFDYQPVYTTEYKPAHLEDRIDRDTKILDRVSTISTPFSPVTGALVKDLVETFFMGPDEERKEILEWIKTSTSTAQKGEEQQPTPEQLGGDDIEELLKEILGGFTPTDDKDEADVRTSQEKGAANAVKA